MMSVVALSAPMGFLNAPMPVHHTPTRAASAQMAFIDTLCDSARLEDAAAALVEAVSDCIEPDTAPVTRDGSCRGG